MLKPHACTQGNCKFGPKCANIHLLPDGRRINYGKNGVTFGQPPSSMNLGSRINPNTYAHSSNSALTNSFLSADNAASYGGAAFHQGGERYGAHHQLGRQPSMENGLPTIDGPAYTSNPASAYGSPRDDDPGRFGLARSPVNNVMSVLDVPLPASFDSNDISHAARFGPWPASVPAKFGFDSPSASLRLGKEGGHASDAVKRLHNSAFGGSGHLSPSNPAAGQEDAMGSSPPTGHVGEEYSFKRQMHSSTSRFPKSRVMSSSVPKIDWETEFPFEEDCVPSNLANEILTPLEKARRGSVRATDGDPISDGLSASATKFGSPVLASSPSRWGPLFQRQREEDVETGSLGKAMKHASAFGHVGSPLRNSSLVIDGELRGSSQGGRLAAPAHKSSGESLSALTQQLQQTRLGEDGAAGESPHLHPNMARLPSAFGAGIIGKERERERGLERHVSSGSIGSAANGRFPSQIDEEDPAFVFNMDTEDDQTPGSVKRKSGGMSGAPWSYAGIVAGKSSNGTGKGRETPTAIKTVGSR